MPRHSNFDEVIGKVTKSREQNKKEVLLFLCRDAVTSAKLTKTREKKKKNIDFSTCYFDCDITPAKTKPIKT